MIVMTVPVTRKTLFRAARTPGLILLAIIVGLILWGLNSPDIHGAVTHYVR